MGTHTKAFERTATNPAGVSLFCQEAESAIAYFRAHHPVDPCDCEYSELSAHIEDTGLLNLSLPFILQGLAETEGAAWHYFRGLMNAYFELRPKVKTTKPIPHLIGELLKVCIQEFDNLNQEAHVEEQASNLAVLETAAYLLVHYSPHEGNQWLEAIYQG
ncbi:hypothetical protein [Limnobacter sp.]|uniref:hypothetical protein n=1 Tax=Limnobacter sp. TaxID=2003368 RepID=UPI002FE3628C